MTKITRLNINNLGKFIIPACVGIGMSVIIVNYAKHIITNHYEKKPYPHLSQKTSQIKMNLFRYFNHLDESLFQITKINTDIDKIENPSQKIKLLQEKNNAIKNFKAQQDNLLRILKNIKGEYSHQSDVTIDQFIQWLNQNLITIFDSRDTSQQNYEVTDLYLKLDKEINEYEIGYPNEEDSRLAYVMSLVPKAVDQLKKNPNDPALCTVLRKDITDNTEQSAQQLAFMKVGNVYCDKYYHTRYAWGQFADDSSNKRDLNSLTKQQAIYESMPYSGYYKKFVIPRISHYVSSYQHMTNEKQKEDLCNVKWYDSPRDPEQDARKEAYLNVGQKYCPNEQRKKDFLNSSLMCLTFIDFMCGDHGCDMAERCKETPGLLFNN